MRYMLAVPLALVLFSPDLEAKGGGPPFETFISCLKGKHLKLHLGDRVETSDGAVYGGTFDEAKGGYVLQLNKAERMASVRVMVHETSEQIELLGQIFATMSWCLTDTDPPMKRLMTDKAARVGHAKYSVSAKGTMLVLAVEYK